jgi:piezo-type mechanosensitive ion channel component 1/2
MVLIVATLAWGLRKLSRAITLTLLFLLVMKRGFIHAVYSMVKLSFSILSLNSCGLLYLVVSNRGQI